MTTGKQKTAAHWDAQEWQAGQGLHWTELDAVQRRLSLKESGTPRGNWLQYFLDTYLSDRLPLERCLSLGCGKGRVERQLARMGAFVACDAYDIAAGSIAEARRLAREAGYLNIHYAVRDLDTIELTPNYYDVVLAAGAVHHFAALENVFSQVQQSLRPGGLFVLNEYVGPNRFQFGERQRAVMRACLQLLPEPYRRLVQGAITEQAERRQGRLQERDWRWLIRRLRDKAQNGLLLATIRRQLLARHQSRRGGRPLKDEMAYPTEQAVIEIDPSEAVRSAEILPLLSRYFTIVENRPLGGTILQFLLSGIAGNFDGPEGEMLLEMLFMIEDVMLACGELESDFAFVIAQAKAQ